MRILSVPVVQQKHNNNLIFAIAQINILVHDQMRIMRKKNTTQYKWRDTGSPPPTRRQFFVPQWVYDFAFNLVG